MLLALGFLVTQPLVFLAMHARIARALVDGDGLIHRAHAAWDHPLLALPLTAVFSILVSAPAWLRILFPAAIRNYERELWIEGRMLVDDAYANAQDIITNLLERVPGFSGTLEVHYADPPYNTKPLVYGLDADLVERDNVKWVPYTSPQEPRAITPKPPRPVEAASPPPPAPPPPKPKEAPAPVELPPPAPVEQAKAEGEELLASWDDPSQDDDEGPPAIAFFDVGRLQVKRAKQNLDAVAPFIARFTGRGEDEVRGMLRNAPDDERVHRLFGDYKKLRSILLQDAGFALDHGLAPVVSIIVQRPLADVEKRMRAAPRDKRLTGVFAPELARRLLKKRV